MANTMNGSEQFEHLKPFQNIWQLYKSSTHNSNMSQITTGTPVLRFFAAKPKGAPKRCDV